MMWPNIPHCCCSDSDVLFLVDSTGSNADFPVELMECLRKRLGNKKNCRYAVADYKDFEDGDEYGENGWKLWQPFTEDRDLVLNALTLMKFSAGGGGDRLEQNLAALKAAAEAWEGNLGGRPDVRRLIIWHGDNPGWEDGAKGFPYPTLQATKDAIDAAGIELVALNRKGKGEGIDEEGATGENEEDKGKHRQASFLVNHHCLLLHGVSVAENSDSDTECRCREAHTRLCSLFLDTLPEN